MTAYGWLGAVMGGISCLPDGPGAERPPLLSAAGSRASSDGWGPRRRYEGLDLERLIRAPRLIMIDVSSRYSQKGTDEVRMY